MLAAARSLFAEKGFEQTTIEEVAERAEFGKGTLYNYFPGGKEELLFALLEDLFAGMASVIREHFAGPDTVPDYESFRSLLARIIQHYTDQREDFLLLMKEAQRLILSGHPTQATLLRQRDEAMHVLTAAVQRASDAGALKPYPPESC
jgi:TetR/AcrR family transcriptional regulator, repressor of fatR-cypB operon